MFKIKFNLKMFKNKEMENLFKINVQEILVQIVKTKGLLKTKNKAILFEIMNKEFQSNSWSKTFSTRTK